MMGKTAPPENPRPFHSRSDLPFYFGLIVLSGFYVALIAGMILSEAAFTSPGYIQEVLADPDIQYALRLSLLTCSMTALLSLWVAVPFGYLLSRFNFFGKTLVDALIDIPIVLPPLVVGLALLTLFMTPAGSFVNTHVMKFTLAVPGVVLAQFAVACAFAVRTMRVTFDQISPRQEEVARTLGCSRGQAFWKVAFPQARRGLVTAGTLAWARSLGEFGPIFAFVGVTRGRTEVLASTIYLELFAAKLHRAAAVSLLMVAIAVLVLIIVRVFGMKEAPGYVK
jgi:molybdate transport system permease protein